MFKFIKSQIEASKQKKLNEEIRRQEERRKQEEIRIQEQENKRKILEKSLKDICVNNGIEVTLLGVDLLTLYGFIKECITNLNINIDQDIFYQNFMDIYFLSRDINTLKEFDNKINKFEVKKIFIKNFKKYISNNNYIDNFRDIIFKSGIQNEMLEEVLYFGRQTFDMVLEQTKDTLSNINNRINVSQSIESCKILTLWMLMMYAVAFNRFFIILKYKKSFLQNEELYNITINLYNEKSKEFDKEDDIYFAVRDKAFSMYENFYSNTFDEKLKVEEFGILSYLICKSYKFKELDIDNSLKEVMSDFNIDYILNKDKIGCSDIENVIYKIGEYFIDSENSFKYMYCDLINICIEKIDTKELITMYSKFIEEMDRVKEIKKNQDLEKEKNRYLNNDFRIEEQIREDKNNFKNISNGQEFEIYLKKLYTRLGYNVELTKTTGDQGADLILYKDGLKIVVQAKFYSSPVGNKAIQEVVGAIKFYDADFGIVVTNNLFTKSAIELAEVNGIELIDEFKLNQLRQQIYDN